MKLSGISEKAFLDRYSLKDKNGDPIEKIPNQMWQRVAGAVAEAEKKKDQKKWKKNFLHAMEDFKYVPGGRILAGAGTGYDVTFYNCYVIPSPADSRGGIIDTLKTMVEIMALGGGVGINLSSLRPRGARVRKVNGSSSGPCNWAELFSLATRDIIQQGGTRRGALMLMLWDWHPDIEEFITVKQDLSRIQGANLSVCVSDSFMEAVKKDADWPLGFPDITDPDYDTEWDGDLEVWKQKGKKVKVHKIVKARKIWDLIAEAAWKSAEPGVVFMERYNKMHNNYYWNRINCVNPCGEEGLPPFGVCNLGSINLSAFVNSTDIDTPGTFNFDALKETVRTAVRFQDNIVDMDPYIFKGIRKTQLEGERRIGLGTMGIGDALIKMHIRYGSPESLNVIDKIYKTICHEAYKESINLAKEKGAFPKFDKNKYPKSGFIQTLPKAIQKDIAKYGIRNSVILMQAPTGTTSLMAGTTSGIEPVFEFEFTRTSRLGKDIIRHHLYEEWYNKHGKDLEAGKIKRPEWFASANDLTPEDHVMVQAVVQKYVDASISKTVNAPNSHTVDEVKKVYQLAYDHGLKGITYMRDGSRQGVLERKPEEKKEDQKEKKQDEYIAPVKPRPMVVHGSTYKINTPVGKAYITINTNEENEPFEVFINVGKAGTDVHAMATALGRVISLTLRISSHLSPYDRINKVMEEIKGIGGANPMGFGKNRVASLPDAVAKVLAMRFKLNGHSDKKLTTMIEEDDNPNLVSEAFQPSLMQQEDTSSKTTSSSSSFDLCPSCGSFGLAYEEGCKKCYLCGYSAC